MNWYVLQVLTTQEQDVAEDIQKLGLETLVPMENRMIRSHGLWSQREYVLFPGYVFFKMDISDSLYHRLKEIAGVVRILSEGGVPAPLSLQEANRIHWLSENLAAPSVVRWGEDGWSVLSGALVPLAGGILQIDRHRRRAYVRFSLGGRPVKIAFSVVFKEW